MNEDPHVMHKPQPKRRIEIQIDGFKILRTILLGISSSAYGGKKTVTAVLYIRP